MSKALACGHAAEVGVTGAVLAEMGFEGNDDVFQSSRGILASWSDDPDTQALFEGLGERFEIEETNLKRYSAGYPIQAPVHGLLGALHEHGIDVGQLERVEVELASHALSIVSDRQMSSISLIDMLVTALLRGNLSFHDVHPPPVHEASEAEDLRRLITISASELLDAQDLDSRQAIVTMTTTAGRVLRLPAVTAPWDHRTPPTWGDVEGKFRTSLEGIISDDRADSIVGSLAHLEELESLSKLFGAATNHDRSIR